MALCSNSHRSLTECDFGPVFLCITTTVSKKGMAKRRRERNGKTSGQEKTNSDMSSEHICEGPQQASGGDNTAETWGQKPYGQSLRQDASYLYRLGSLGGQRKTC